jgi:hypothetical protein
LVIDVTRFFNAVAGNSLVGLGVCVLSINHRRVAAAASTHLYL